MRVCVAQSYACVLHRVMCVCVLHRACLVVLLHRAMGGHLRSFDGTDKVAQIKVIEANIFGCKSHVSKFAAGRA